jgi:5-methylcytosine-specific restriction enzyme subunit McrC
VRRLALSEHQRAAFSRIDLETARQLARTGAVTISRGWPDGTTVLHANSTVGILRAGTGDDRVELHIEPKLGVSRLLWLLGHARDQSGWRDDEAALGSTQGLIPAMAVMFAGRSRRALSSGVIRGYREVEETLPGLRGRLREADQMRARPGIALPLEVRFDDYTADVAENQLLKTATQRLLQLNGIPGPVRMQLTQLSRTLTEASLLTRGAPLPSVRLTRLNRHYGPALTLAQLILQHTSVEHRGPKVDGSGFAFDMNRVYEDWLTSALAAAMNKHGGTVRRQQPLALDLGEQVRMQTDITWWTGKECRAVIDAKYKRLLPSGPRPEDLYQMLAYCTALGLRSAHLVYPAGGPARMILVRNAGVTIHAHVVPLDASLDDVLEAVDRLAAAVAWRAAS